MQLLRKHTCRAVLLVLGSVSVLMFQCQCAAAAAPQTGNTQHQQFASSERSAAVEQQWADFWGSKLPQGISTLQAMKSQVHWLKYMKPSKQKNPPDTAGLDLAMSDTLQALGQELGVREAHAWLKSQVTTEVLRAIHTLQHPKDCAAARKLVCDLTVSCGFGCQVHCLVQCLNNAIALNRTLVLKADPWHYSPDQDAQKTWEELMAPVSTCTVRDLKSQDSWPVIVGGDNLLDEEQEVYINSTGGSGQHTPFDVPMMPIDVLQVARLFHIQPETWWVGVLASYLLRPSPQSAARHAEVRRSFGSTTNNNNIVVGVHIRRSDKVAWGRSYLHVVEEYMTHVERYCDWRLGPDWWVKKLQHEKQQAQMLAEQQHKQEQADQVAASGAESGASPPGCVVYLASDEPAVLEEMREYYPHIQVVANPLGLETGGVDKRYSLDGIRGIYDDLMLLSSADFNVGTLSSQIGRLTYELSQVNGSTEVSDRSLHFHSLDVRWFYEGSRSFEFCITKGFAAGKVGHIVKAGQHVACRSPFHVEEGHIKCGALHEGKAGTELMVPPGVLGRCSTFETTTYRNLLPAYMRQQPGSVQEQQAPKLVATE